MPSVEVTLPDRIADEIDRFVEQDEFVNREQAFEELLSMGMSAYDTAAEPDTELEAELFTRTFDDQRDPAMPDEGDDEYTL